ncbi:MAG: hypothetical protein ACRDQD_31640 [Nocardioidaceae bacterium]
MSAGAFNSLLAIVTLGGLAWLLYRPKVQESVAYKATVVPLAEIMDVGFIVFSPIIILLFGYTAPWAMLGLCLLAILTGFAMAYNINTYEPLVGKPDPLHRWNTFALWALVAASVVNVAYYALLLMTLVLLPLGDLYSPERAAITAAVLLGILTVYGFAKGLMALNELGNKATAFNLSAIAAVLVAFATFNVQRLVGGDFDWPDLNAADDAEALRKLLGLFVLVQGFESSRYIGAYFSADTRVRTMRSAQYIASIVYVLFVALSLILFATVKAPDDVTAIFEVSEEVSVFLPFLIMAAALGSQLSAIVNDTETRTEMLAQQVGDRLRRRWTFPLFLVPAIVIVLITDVTAAVALASRVFAAYYLLQALIAARLAWRAEKWGSVGLFTGVGLVMAAVAVFGIPS